MSGRKDGPDTSEMFVFMGQAGSIDCPGRWQARLSSIYEKSRSEQKIIQKLKKKTKQGTIPNCSLLRRLRFCCNKGVFQSDTRAKLTFTCSRDSDHMIKWSIKRRDAVRRVRQKTDVPSNRSRDYLCNNSAAPSCAPFEHWETGRGGPPVRQN